MHLISIVHLRSIRSQLTCSCQLNRPLSLSKDFYPRQKLPCPLFHVSKSRIANFPDRTNTGRFNCFDHLATFSTITASADFDEIAGRAYGCKGLLRGDFWGLARSCCCLLALLPDDTAHSLHSSALFHTFCSQTHGCAASIAKLDRMEITGDKSRDCWDFIFAVFSHDQPKMSYHAGNFRLVRHLLSHTSLQLTACSACLLASSAFASAYGSTDLPSSCSYGEAVPARWGCDCHPC